MCTHVCVRVGVLEMGCCAMTDTVGWGVKKKRLTCCYRGVTNHKSLIGTNLTVHPTCIHVLNSDGVRLRAEQVQ